MLNPIVRDAFELEPVSQCLHHWRGSDRRLQTVDGIRGALSRAFTVAVDDTNGTNFNVGYHQPAFEHKTFPINGVNTACMTLRLGSADRLYFPFDARPQAMAIYCEFLHFTPATDEALLSITNDAVTGARFLIDWSGTKWRAAFHNGTTNSSVSLSGTAPVNGQTVRLWAYLIDSGGNMSVQLNQSISEGTATATSASTPVTRAGAWGTGQKLRYSALGTSAGVTTWHRLVKLLPGAPSLAQISRTF